MVRYVDKVEVPVGDREPRLHDWANSPERRVEPVDQSAMVDGMKQEAQTYWLGSSQRIKAIYILRTENRGDPNLLIREAARPHFSGISSHIWMGGEAV
jgi:hypothetical protein